MSMSLIAPGLVGLGLVLILVFGLMGLFKAFYKKVDQGTALIVKLRPPVPPSLLGRVGTVISPEVDARQGRAEFADGGAGLILQVRAAPPGGFGRGDRVVLLEHDAAANTYLVISESQFNAH